MKIFLLMCFTGLLVFTYAQNNRCPPSNVIGICVHQCDTSGGGLRCPSGQICCRIGCGTQCVSPAVPSWCPFRSPRKTCRENVCRVMTCPRFRRARCRNDNPCEPECEGNFYQGRRRISRSRCRRRSRGRSQRRSG